MKATHNPPALDTEPDITPANLLRGAALYLTLHGWTQHQFFDMLAATDGPFLPACASGAIATAAHGRCFANGIGTVDIHREDTNTIAAVRAMRVLAAYLDPEYTGNAYDTSAIDVIGDWNDADGRTLDEVTQALNDAADDWDRTHHTGGAR